jgi:putative tryptophan/tyrosine transport system substrate-binding protein
MRRREFVTLLGGAAAWPLAARAQPSERMRRIVVVMAMTENDPQSQLNVGAVRRGLAESGWLEGRDLKIDFLFGLTNPDRANASAAALLTHPPDAFLAQGTAVTAALHRQTRTVPIIFAVVSDPVGNGFVASLNRPGGNITGFTNHFEPSVGARWLQLLKEIAPRLTRVAILLNPDIAAGPGAHFVQPVEAAATTLRVEIRQLQIRKPEDIEPAVSAWAREPNSGLIISPDPVTVPQRERIVALAAHYHLPAVYPYRFFLTDGGLISYGIDYAEVFRSAAKYTDRILRGEKPADLPVQLPTKFEMVINLRSAKSLGLQVPDKLLALADELIE